jgi:hypothetical protein
MSNSSPLKKQVPDSDENQAGTPQVSPEGSTSEEAASQAAPDTVAARPARKRVRKVKAKAKAAKPKSEAKANSIPEFEKVDQKAFAKDPLAAAAAAERNTSQFFKELENFRLNETELAGQGVGREILTRVPVRRPGRKEFVRCHEDPRMTIPMALYVDDSEDGDGEAYMVAKAMRDTFGDDVKSVLLQAAMLRNGTIILWPLTIPQADGGRGRSWHESALIASDHAKKQWVKIISDRTLGGYRVFPAEGEIPEPKWPDKTIEELLEIAFRNRVIKSTDHPIVRKYLGRC